MTKYRLTDKIECADSEVLLSVNCYKPTTGKWYAGTNVIVTTEQILKFIEMDSCVHTMIAKEIVTNPNNFDIVVNSIKYPDGFYQAVWFDKLKRAINY